MNDALVCRSADGPFGRQTFPLSVDDWASSICALYLSRSSRLSRPPSAPGVNKQPRCQHRDTLQPLTSCSRRPSGHTRAPLRSRAFPPSPIRGARTRGFLSSRGEALHILTRRRVVQSTLLWRADRVLVAYFMYLSSFDRSPRHTGSAVSGTARKRERVQLGSQLRRRRHPRRLARGHRVTGRPKTAECADTVLLCSRWDHAVPPTRSPRRGHECLQWRRETASLLADKGRRSIQTRLCSGWRQGRRREAPVQELNQFWPRRHSAAPSVAFCSFAEGPTVRDA